MNAAFTIVAKNYIGLAKVLKESVQKYNSDLAFYIFVADEPDNSYHGEDGVFFAKNCVSISTEKWLEMSFKYTLTEFCTAIKPYCFKYLFDKEFASKVIYFDPDIYVFSSLSYFYDKLDDVSVILVPHIALPNLENDKEKTFLQSGIFNLGFAALKFSNTSLALIDWWGQKLLESCFDDVLDYTFTDQKWMNFVPALFPSNEVFISRHLGANIAPWNFYERQIYLINGIPSFVRSRLKPEEQFPVLFIHFSGFNYKSLLLGEEKRTRFGLYDMTYQDVAESLSYYVHKISENRESMLCYFSLPYTYGTYSNGYLVDKVHRRLYRSLSKRENVGNPFDCANPSFFKKIDTLNMVSTTTTTGVIANTSSLAGKLKMFNRIMSYVYKIVGYRRYIALLRLMKHFSKFEAQIFLLNKKYIDSNIDLLNNR